MQSIKYQRLKADFQKALSSDNLEKCIELLRRDFLLGDDQQKELIMFERRLNQARRERQMNTIDFDKFSMETSQVANSLNDLFSKLGEDVVSFADAIHDRILVVACKNSPTDWEKLFPDAFFSHIHIIRYGEEVPVEYTSSDVVIFDDLDCPGIGNDAQIRALARSMPQANLLFYGLPGENIFKKKNAPEEDQGFAARCADANSKFTLHARLRELLEFRKIYGSPT